MRASLRRENISVCDTCNLDTLETQSNNGDNGPDPGCGQERDSCVVITNSELDVRRHTEKTAHRNATSLKTPCFQMMTGDGRMPQI